MEPNEQMRYLCVDLKSFYASVECKDRGLDPLTADLVVADLSRTEKTICLAVSPAMKAKGVRNRCRVFEIPKGLTYEVAPPRMARYIEASAEIYGIYLSWVSKDDIHVYSIDEAFIDLAPYLAYYGLDATTLGRRIRADVVERSGIPATAGLGTNLYLAKVALDISAKHARDFFAVLDEDTYRETLWQHRPITDFWRVGPGTARRLERLGIHTMGELAVAPEELVYDAFGVDAEILIDHAWGQEPVGMAEIKAYKPATHCITNAQVLGCALTHDKALTIVKEMAEAAALELAERHQEASSVVVWVAFELTAEERAALRASGEARYWRGPADGGTVRFVAPTASRREIVSAATRIFEGQVGRDRLVKRMSVTLDGVVADDAAGVQLSLFTNAGERSRERRRQEAVSAVKGRFGKNALLSGIDLLPEATARERNEQIGGHRAR